MKSIDSQSGLSPTPSYGSNWGHKIADFFFQNPFSTLYYVISNLWGHIVFV